MKIRLFTKLLYILALMTPLVFSACTAASPSPTALPTSEPVKVSTTSAPAQTDTPQPPTATLVPTATMTATQIPPTATLTPTLAVLPAGFSVWCVPDKVQVTADDKSKPWVIPGNVTAGEMVKGMTEVKYTAQWCTFIYTFNQPAPQGARLEFSDYVGNPGKPWLTVDLQPVPGQPNSVYGVVDHQYVINPPRWWVEYKLALRTADGTVQWNEPVRFKRSWQMAPCWNTLMPNPVTLRCPNTSWGDIHPSDPGYGLPTWTTIPH